MVQSSRECCDWRERIARSAFVSPQSAQGFGETTCRSWLGRKSRRSMRLFGMPAQDRRFVRRSGSPVSSVTFQDRHLCRRRRRKVRNRSEEHTSELQSPDHLVCRLLLENKKYTTRSDIQ